MGPLYQADLESNARLQKLRFFPLALTGGAGRRVIDESGRSLLDLSAAWGAASLGYGHPRFVEAVTLGEEALRRGESLTHEQVGERLRRFLQP